MGGKDFSVGLYVPSQMVESTLMDSTIIASLHTQHDVEVFHHSARTLSMPLESSSFNKHSCRQFKNAFK